MICVHKMMVCVMEYELMPTKCKRNTHFWSKMLNFGDKCLVCALKMPTCGHKL